MEVDYSCIRTLAGIRKRRIPRTVNVKDPPPVANSEKSPLEALPLDILIKVLCGVDHGDLEQLFHVSKTIREATLFAKDLHFNYSTPKKRTLVSFEEIEVPNAPVIKSRSRHNGRKRDLLVTLFAYMDDDDEEIEIYL